MSTFFRTTQPFTMKIYFFAFGILISNLLAAQRTNVISRQNQFYLGFMNSLEVNKNTFPCGKIVIESDHGEVYNDGCDYKFYSEIGGTIHFIAYEKTDTGLKKIDEADFKMKWLDKPYFKIGSGKARAPRYEILKQNAVSIECGNLKYGIKSFTVTVLFRQTNTFKTVTNISEKLNDETKSLFQQLKPEDSISFGPIFATDPNGKDIYISGTTLTVY